MTEEQTVVDAAGRRIWPIAVVIAVAVIGALVVLSQSEARLAYLPPGAPPRLSASRLPGEITLGDYLALHRGTTGPPFVPLRVATLEGQIVEFTVTDLPAGDNARCEVRWSTLDRDRLRPAEEDFWRYDNVRGWPEGLLTRSPPASSTASGQLWVPLPNAVLDVGWFVIRVGLYCSDQVITHVDTEEFRVDSPLIPTRANPPPAT